MYSLSNISTEKMPKKFSGENTKAVAARERKKQSKEKSQTEHKSIENDEFKDEHKGSLKKQQKKEADERKKQQTLQRKAETKKILQKEMEEASEKPTKKVTRAEIKSRLTVPVEQKEAEHFEKPSVSPLFENLNRLQVGEESARTVDEAIGIFKEKEIDKHPEKRLKAAYSAYEKKRLEELKKADNGLRLSQMKQTIFKEWQKSPENPLNNS
nr:coiled-coil domain-containing protein 124 [Leptinotarsa decemlineata]